MIELAFTVKPLWGWLIMQGIKDVENRAHGVNPPRGTCAVTFSKVYSRGEYEDCLACLRDSMGYSVKKLKALPTYEELAEFRGKLVGIVDYEVAPTSGSKWYQSGSVAWKVSNPRWLKTPFPVTGFVNMWRLKPADAKKVGSVR